MQKYIFRVRKQTAESSSVVHGERFYLTESIHTVKSTVLQSYRRPIQIFSALPDTSEACFQSPFVQGELKEWSLKVQTVTRKQWHGFTHTDETNTNAPEGLASTTKDVSSGPFLRALLGRSGILWPNISVVWCKGTKYILSWTTL